MKNAAYDKGYLHYVRLEQRKEPPPRHFLTEKEFKAWKDKLYEQLRETR